VIASGAIVERCIVWEDARISGRANMTDSIVAAGALVGSDAVLERAILANGARVLDAAAPEPGTQVMPNETAPS